MQEFGGQSKEEEEEAEAEEGISNAKAAIDTTGIDDAKNKSESVQRKGAGTGKLEGRLIVKERRTTGSVSWRGRCSATRDSQDNGADLVPRPVYGDYIKAGKGWITVPMLLVCMFLMQGSSIVNNYTLVWWQAKYVA